MAQEPKLWGEFVDNDPKPRYKYTSVLEAAKNPNCLNRYLSILPAIVRNRNVKQLIQLPSMEPRMLHTILLHQHANQVAELIKKRGNGFRNPPPPIPEFPDISPKCKEQRNQFGYLAKTSNEFTTGNGPDFPELNSTIRTYILKQCIATMFAQMGFEKTNLSVLEVLCDVLDEMLTKICSNLRTAVDNSNLSLSEGFPDEVERVFTEMGLGGVHSLHNYYVNRIINYEKIMYKQCEDLMKEYDELDKEDVPEFHLSGGEDDHSELLLQPELQMLDYLEQNDEFSLQDAFGNPTTLQDLEQIFNS